MRQYGIFGIYVLLMIILAGCSVTIGGGGHGGWEGASQAERVTIAEIDAAAALTLESNRQQTLKNIAMRPQLSADVQVYLVQVSLDYLMLESSRKSVVLALIGNPGFVSEAKMTILEDLDQLILESSRQEVLNSLNRRGYVPSGKEMEVIINPQEQTDQSVQMETTVEMTYSTGL